MKKIIRQIINTIRNFFDRIIDEEAKRVDRFNRRILYGC
jgi:hypothetical protein